MIGKLLLNRYELLEKIGEGGMGIVYKAKCHVLNRFVAVKILKAELSDDKDFVARFKREANSVASLSHPNIVNVHDVGSENNVNFIVMEYINGETLKQIIRKTTRLSTEIALDISVQISRALECAHRNNIIHRDIKPDNIMITEDNIVKVTDFGIAKVADAETITNSNKITGSVHYFSPEQAKGSFVDCRTDIYSLGIVMYEMLTGQVPYNAESSIAIAIMHIQKPVVPPKEVNPNIPENINQVILKALEKKPINRYQTAKEMSQDLNSIRKNSNFIVGLNNKAMDATTVMMAPIVAGNDFTTVMDQVPSLDKVLLGKKGASRATKVMIIIGLIILVILIGASGKYILKKPLTTTKVPVVKATVSKDIVKPPVEEKKLVPSLTGSTQANANTAIVNNGFLLGNVSNAYSDTVSKGLIISQSPVLNTPYEKNGKIDIVISDGQKIDPVAPPQVKWDHKGKKK